MWKKWMALVSVMALCLFSAAPALGQTGEETVSQEMIPLSLAEAVEIALNNNLEVALRENAVAKAKVSLRQARSTADELDALIEYTGATLETLQAVYVGPKAAEMNLLLAELAAEYTKKGLMLSVEKAYYDVLKAQAEVNLKEAALERAKEQLRLAEASVAVGMAAKSDVMAAQVGVTSAEVQLATAKNNLEAAMMALAKVLGRDLSERYVLTTEFDFAPVEEMDLGAYIAELLEKDVNVVGAREGLAVAELQFEQVKKMYTPNVFAYQQAQHDLIEAQLKYEQAKTDLIQSVRQAYLNLKTAEQAYRLLEENVKYAEETARLAALRYEAGVATRLEMEKAFDALNEAEAQRLSMLYNYNLAKAQLRYGIFGGGSAVTGAGGV